MSESIFEVLDASLVNDWKNHDLTEKDFYCRDCGKLIIDLDEIKNVQVDRSTQAKFLIRIPKTKKYIESDHNRWAVIGRKINGKIYYRKICWECFFKKLRATTDIARKARKSCWYKKLNQGIDAVPTASSCPSEYFKFLFDVSDEDLNKERSKFDTASIKSFIRRFGEEEGAKKFEEYKKRQAYTCSKEYMAKTRGWTEEQWNEFNQSRASTKHNFIKRYGKDAGLDKWDKYTKQYFIDKFGKEEGTKKYLELNAKKAITLQNFINKYGDEVGKEKFKNVRNKSYSTVSQRLFIDIDNALGNFAKYSQYSVKEGGEKVINVFFDDGECKVCMPDYCLNNKIIEFNGDYWHANPEFYSEDSFVHDSCTAGSIWEKDRKRKEALEKLGYKVKVVWENEYHSDKDKILQECCEFLKS